MRILFIEDDTALCAALAPALAGLGKADFCHTGPEGLSLLVSSRYDLCILDRMLPGLDGLTLLRAARAQGVTTPVLLLTALAGAGDTVDGLDAGADDYLAKPFDTAVLLARLRALLRRSGGTAALTAGNLRLDTGELTLTGPTDSAVLSRKECDLLEALMRTPGSGEPFWLQPGEKPTVWPCSPTTCWCWLPEKRERWRYIPGRWPRIPCASNCTNSFTCWPGRKTIP